MCMVSVLHRAAQDQIPMEYWTRETYNKFKEIIVNVNELDKIFGMDNCGYEEKKAFEIKIEEHLNQQEIRSNE